MMDINLKQLNRDFWNLETLTQRKIITELDVLTEDDWENARAKWIEIAMRKIREQDKVEQLNFKVFAAYVDKMA